MNHTKQKSWPQRLLALLAAVVLCAALPAAALAEENTASIQTQVSEKDEDIPWADPPQSTPETGRPDPAVLTPPPQDPATPETAQTGEYLEGYSLSLGETVTIYFYVTLPASLQRLQNSRAPQVKRVRILVSPKVKMGPGSLTPSATTNLK